MKSALMIIDMQRSLFDKEPWNSDGVLERVCSLVRTARKAAVPIVFVRDRRVKPDPRLHPPLEVTATDILIEKNYCDSFLETSLDAELKAHGIERLLIAGLQTDFCIDTTCRRAASLGYRVLLISDAHTTFDHEDLTAAQIVAHHNRILRRFPAGKGSVSTIASGQVSFD